ncbi:MAG: hypothetical protein EOM05_09685 [Clostridia bacterium]|nr:hypothetical protein [Clostridia bacterium]
MKKLNHSKFIKILRVVVTLLLIMSLVIWGFSGFDKTLLMTVLSTFLSATMVWMIYLLIIKPSEKQL